MTYQYEATKEEFNLGAKLIVGLTNGADEQEDKNECVKAMLAWVKLHHKDSPKFGTVAPLVKIMHMANMCAEDIAPHLDVETVVLKNLANDFLQTMVSQDDKIGERMAMWAEDQEDSAS